MWFIALAIPFFGVVNDLLGAFCVTFETFILPPLAFNLYYQGRPDRQAAAFIKPRWVADPAVLGTGTAGHLTCGWLACTVLCHSGMHCPVLHQVGAQHAVHTSQLYLRPGC